MSKQSEYKVYSHISVLHGMKRPNDDKGDRAFTAFTLKYFEVNLKY